MLIGGLLCATMMSVSVEAAPKKSPQDEGATKQQAPLPTAAANYYPKVLQGEREAPHLNLTPDLWEVMDSYNSRYPSFPGVVIPAETYYAHKVAPLKPESQPFPSLKEAEQLLWELGFWKRQWVPQIYDCDDFANDTTLALCHRMMIRTLVFWFNRNILYREKASVGHQINIIGVTKDGKQVWCPVEPQEAFVYDDLCWEGDPYQPPPKVLQALVDIQEGPLCKGSKCSMVGVTAPGRIRDDHDYPYTYQGPGAAVKKRINREVIYYYNGRGYYCPYDQRLYVSSNGAVFCAP